MKIQAMDSKRGGNRLNAAADRRCDSAAAMSGKHINVAQPIFPVIAEVEFFDLELSRSNRPPILNSQYMQGSRVAVELSADSFNRLLERIPFNGMAPFIKAPSRHDRNILRAVCQEFEVHRTFLCRRHPTGFA